MRSKLGTRGFEVVQARGGLTYDLHVSPDGRVDFSTLPGSNYFPIVLFNLDTIYKAQACCLLRTVPPLLAVLVGQVTVEEATVEKLLTSSVTVLEAPNAVRELLSTNVLGNANVAASCGGEFIGFICRAELHESIETKLAGLVDLGDAACVYDSN